MAGDVSRFLYKLDEIREKGEPELKDYDTLEAWAHALIDWKIERRLKGYRARVAALEAQLGIVHPKTQDN